MRPSRNAATRLATRISKGKPRDPCGTISMRNSRSMAPSAPPTNTSMTILITALALCTGERGPKLPGQQAGQDGQQKIRRGKADAALSCKLGSVELHTAEGRVAAEYSGQNKRIQYHAVTVAVVPVDPEQHGQIPN